METLAYVSRSRIHDDREAAAAILRMAQVNNARMGVTGALYFDDRQFFQILEGDRACLTALMARIVADPRHGDVVLLHRAAIPARRFAGWAMKPVEGARLAYLTGSFTYEKLCAAAPACLERRRRLIERLAPSDIAAAA